MKNLCALLRSPIRPFCRACGDDPCVCDVRGDKRELKLRRQLRAETLDAFARARAEAAAWHEKNGTAF